MRRLTFVGLLLFCVLTDIPTQIIGQSLNPSANAKPTDGRPLSQADKDAVLQAIVDEMYANDLQPEVIDVGIQISPSEYQMEAYIQPHLNKDNAAWVIYKLMPYGEVYRLFAVEANGLGVLYGRLRNHFPPTEPSYLTVYMDDDDLWKMKKEWGKSYFTVDLKPSAKRIAEAQARQRRRMAY